MPWQKVFGAGKRPLTASQRFAAAVTLGELDGGQFDWAAMEWKKRG